MKRFAIQALCAWSLFAWALAPLVAQDAAEEKFTPTRTGEPDITFEASDLDLGDVDDSRLRTFNFTFTNTGTEVLEILGVDVACPCTKADVEGREFDPGETGRVVVWFDGKGFKGLQSKQITVYTNVRGKEKTRLHFWANVRTRIMVEPENAAFGPVRQKTGGEMVVVVEARLEASIKATGVRVFGARSIRAKLGKVEIVQPEEEGDLVLTRIPIRVTVRPRSPLGHLRGRIELQTDDPEYAEIKIPISGEVTGDLFTSPRVVTFGKVAPGEAVVKNLRIENLGEKPFKIVGVKPGDLPVTWDIVKEEKTGIQGLQLTFTAPEGVAAQLYRGSIEITLDHPEAKTLGVAVTAAVRGDE
jgi:hypothetical protein